MHEALGRRRVRHGEDDEVGQRQQRVERVGPVELRARPGGASRRRASTPITRMPKAAASRAASAPMPPTPDDQRRRLGQVDHAAVSMRLRPPLAPELLREIVVQPAREREHEGHDVGADVVVVDLAEIRDDGRVRDQLRIVEARRRRGLRRLQPAQPRGACSGARPAACRTRPRRRRQLPRRLAVVLGHHDGQLGHRRRRAARPTRASSPSAAAASRSACHLLTKR